MAENSKKDMGTGSVKKWMVSLAVPALVGQVVNLLYNIVDRIYIGHLPEIGADALTGVGLFTPILMLITAFALLSGFCCSAFQLLSFRFRFRLSARSALPFGFRLRSSLRILPFQASCVLSFFASFPFGSFALRFAFASRSLCSASLRFRSVPLPCCFLHS